MPGPTSHGWIRLQARNHDFRWSCAAPQQSSMALHLGPLPLTGRAHVGSELPRGAKYRISDVTYVDQPNKDAS